MEIGFAGVGRMGRPMAINLAAAGHRVVAYDTNAQALGALSGDHIETAGSVRELACLPVSISMLPDAATTTEFLVGADGLFATARPGHCHVVMGTVGPNPVRELAERGAERGIEFADAPVSGSVPAAQAAQLATMVGAEPAVFARIEPVLAAMTAKQTHVGPVGAGSAVKLAINVVIAALNQAIAEALLLGEASGVAPDVLYDVLAESAAGSPWVRAKRPAFLGSDSTPVTAPISLLAKDLQMTLGLAAQCGRRLPGASNAAEVLEAACASGDGALDVARVLNILRTMSADPVSAGRPAVASPAGQS